MLNMEGVAEFLTFGFTLEGKTMRKELTIPSLQVPDIDYSMSSRIEDVYHALKESMRKSIQSDSGLALSGGLDSRVLAGIAAELGEKIPTFTWGTSNFERTVARKVASLLKLPHYEISMDPRLSEKSIERLKQLVMETGGTVNVANLYVRTTLSQHLENHDIKALISATGFDEVNGAAFAHKVSSVRQFCDVFVQTFAHSMLPYEYREIAKKNLSKCCKKASFCTLYPIVYVKNQFKTLKNGWPIEDITPVVDKKVLSSIVSLPYEKRINKRMQKTILRRYFPKLYKIPYAMSGLTPIMPYHSHIMMRKLVRALCVYIPKGRPRPLLTFDYQWFIKNNIRIFERFLYSNLPPLIDTKTVQKLLYRLQTNGSISVHAVSRDGVFLDQLLTYALLVSQLSGQEKHIKEKTSVDLRRSLAVPA